MKTNLIFQINKKDLESYLNDNKDNLDKQEKELMNNLLKTFKYKYYDTYF